MLHFDNIIHLADIHIRLLSRHEEYENVFNKLYEYINKIPGNNIVVIAGDVVHSKIDINPELVHMVSKLFKNLSSLYPLVVIPGNHDMNLKNKSRMDSLSPIINNIDSNNIYYLPNTGTVDIGNISFSTVNVAESIENLPNAQNINTNNVKVALYHGMVQGSTNDNGFKFEHGVEHKYFKGYDLVLLGDIHKRQYFSKTMAYPGSLIQQDFGESIDNHGGIIWNLKTLEGTNFDIENQNCFYKIKINPSNKNMLDFPEIYDKQVYLTVVATEIEDNELLEIEILLKDKYNIKKYILDNTTSVTHSVNNFNIDEQKNIDVQKKVITEYINNNYQVSDDELIGILNLHSNLYKSIEEKYVRKFNKWIPLEMKYSNLFSYGENNVIDFRSLNGITGIFAENASGKSSIMDILLFVIYDKTLKTSKIPDILNNTKDTFNVEFKFQVDNTIYVIERVGKRNSKSVKVDVNFYMIENGVETSLNGDKRSSTNKNIREILGEFEEFVLLCLSPQRTNISFLEMKQSERKDVLSTFLDMNFYDELHNISKEQSREMATIIKHLEKRDFNNEIDIVKEDIKLYENEHDKLKVEYNNISNNIENISNDMVEIKSTLKTIVEMDENISDLENNLELYTKSKNNLLQELDEINSNILKEENDISVLEVLDSSRIEKLNNAIEEHESYNFILTKLNDKLNSISFHESSLANHEYDPECEYCIKNEFVVHATEQIKQKPNILNEITHITEKQNLIDIEQLKEIQKKNNENANLITLKNNNIKNLLTTKSNHLSEISILEKKIVDCNAKIKIYNENKVNIEFNRDANRKLQLKQSEYNTLREQENRLKQNIITTESKIHSNKVHLENVKNDISEYKKKVTEYKIYDIYSNITHRNSIPLKILEKTLPVIKDTMNGILKQFVDFNVDLELDGDNIEFYICYGENKWNVELISGMERFIISIIFKIALSHISNLPKTNFLFIDEGFGVLDKKHFNTIIDLFQVFKTLFKFVLIVSHIDDMRDYVDDLIDVGKNNGYSHIFTI